MKKAGIFLTLILLAYVGFSQDSLPKNGKIILYFPNHQISSEGFMKDGKPDAYWKNYYENGILKSEGNRFNFLLDSTWKFYNPKGKLTLEVNYKNAKKNGIRRTINGSEMVEEHYKDDIKEGVTKTYTDDTVLVKSVNFENGLEEGKAKEYDKTGTVITLMEYKKGVLLSREKINRVDKNNLKQGLWVYFYPNDITKTEIDYRDNKKNGYVKEYDAHGNLKKITKYVDDVAQENVEELKEYDIKTDYYPNGKVKIVGSYYQNKADGVRREYDANGKIIKSYIFKNGTAVGKGIVDESGRKQGVWTEYYETGEIRAEGSYKDNKRTGIWNFYYPSGGLEQSGNYDANGQFQDVWKWYYLNGNLHKEENFSTGQPDGKFTEYNDTGAVVLSGTYIEGEENGIWYSNYGDCKEIGKYLNGKRDSLWKSWYNTGQLSFEGRFIDDNPNGKHIFYWENGVIKEQGVYIMGKKEAVWTKYDMDGNIILSTYFKDGIEKKYMGVTIDKSPPEQNQSEN